MEIVKYLHFDTQLKIYGVICGMWGVGGCGGGHLWDVGAEFCFGQEQEICPRVKLLAAFDNNIEDFLSFGACL